MIDLFRTEIGEQGRTLTDGLLAIEEDPTSARHLEELMRAAHSIKGAAKLVGIEVIVQLSHVMEDVFVAAQNATVSLNENHIDILLRAVDLISSISELPEDKITDWKKNNEKTFAELLTAIEDIQSGKDAVKESQPLPPDSEKNEEAAKTPEEIPDKTAELANASMLDLFRTEIADQSTSLSVCLLSLEEDPKSASRLEALMRAAHSIKGAARMVGVDAVVELSHVMEDVFVAAQKSELILKSNYVDVLLATVDKITAISNLTDKEMMSWDREKQSEIENLLKALAYVKLQDDVSLLEMKSDFTIGGSSESAAYSDQKLKPGQGFSNNEDNGKDRILRVTADRWDYLMSLAGEVKVEASCLHPYVTSLSRLKQSHTELVEFLDNLRNSIDDFQSRGELLPQLLLAQTKATECRQKLTEDINNLDSYDRRINNLSQRLHRETIITRMRPFSDGIHGFQRMVRDIAKSLGKKIRLKISGLSTQVDRDVLEKMEAPLNHILRNAIDHGIELPEERKKAGKAEHAIITVTATHSEGMLSIIIEDDGRGIDLEQLRAKVVEKGQVTAEMGAKLGEEELLDFLFLPSFSTKDEVTDLSGRGVGLDVVLDVIQAMHGTVKTTTKLGKGTQFHLQLPITLSVIPSLIVDIAGEPYAFPLAKLNHIVKIPASEVEVLEDHQFATINNVYTGLIGASLVFGFGPQLIEGDELSVIVIGDQSKRYGVVVDRFITQKDLAVQSIDPRLGKIENISATALLEDGSPVLLIDVKDLLYSVDDLVKGGHIAKFKQATDEDIDKEYKHILVVDDSLTVREVERNLLETAGYQVDIAVDGRDGWNAIRSFEKYDLIITDIDMPRMDGFELVRTIKGSRKYGSLPVVIVSYKERAEDRKRGLEVGADYYLTKGSFHDNSFLDAVTDLIGEV